MPASTLIGASCHQVPSGSLHASTRNVQVPSLDGSSGTRTVACHRSVPGAPGAMRRNGCCVPSGACTTTSAATASCPSLNTFAATAMSSPVTARAGYRPHDTVGLVAVIAIRPTIAATVPRSRRRKRTGSIRWGQPLSGALETRVDDRTDGGGQ